MSNDILTQITNGIVDGNPDLVLELTAAALAAGHQPLVIIERALTPGMDIVGEKFANGEYFLPNMIISAKGMQQAMALLEPELMARKEERPSSGVVVIGTVHGDIHEIGKSLVAAMLAANGFEVHDLGVDVSIEDFLAKIEETGASLLGLSALLTTTMTMQRETILALQSSGLREQVKVLVGGAPVSQSWAEQIGADGYAEDAMRAIAVARRLLVGS